MGTGPGLGGTYRGCARPRHPHLPRMPPPPSRRRRRLRPPGPLPRCDRGGAARAPPAPRQPGAAGLPPSGISGGRDDPPPDNGGPGSGGGGGVPRPSARFREERAGRRGSANRCPRWRGVTVMSFPRENRAWRRTPAASQPAPLRPSQRAETTVYQRGLFAGK